jgi:hypothetical protein
MGLLDRKKVEVPAVPPVAPPAEVKQELATPQPAGVATTSINLMDDAGAGQETMSREDFAIPRLSILQSLSPQCAKREATYIEGAEAGHIFDNITTEMYDGEEGITVIPVSYRRANIEWNTRANGGGFVADHGLDDSCLADCSKDDKGAMITPRGTVIVTTAEYLCLVVDPATGTAKQVAISMSKSQLKKARKWNTMISQLQVATPDGKGFFNPAMFYRSYKLNTIPESNDQGNWFGWNIKPSVETLSIPGGESIYLSARKFRSMINAGEVKVAAHSDEPAGATGAGSSDDDSL